MIKTLLPLIVIMLLGLTQNTNASDNAEDSAEFNQTNKRIIALSPHLTELVYALEQQAFLVGVSDYSDYPAQAAALPSVASYQGANIAEIIRLQASHILVWQGGNKDADIQRLKQQGFNIYLSTINTPQDLVTDILNIGEFLAIKDKASALANTISAQLDALNQTKQDAIPAVYYLNRVPMVGLGSDSWLNSLLALCNIQNIYKNNAQAYPQLNIADIIRRQPEIIIAANGSTYEVELDFWQVHSRVLGDTSLLTVEPNAMHRFTPRAIDETVRLCKQLKHTTLIN